jgi:hypothetical protein
MFVILELWNLKSDDAKSMKVKKCNVEVLGILIK